MALTEGILRFSPFSLLPSPFSLSLRDSTARIQSLLLLFSLESSLYILPSILVGRERGNRLTLSPAMVKLKEIFLLGPAEAGEDERLLKDLLVSSPSDKEGERRFFDGFPSPFFCGSHTASAVSFLSPF